MGVLELGYKHERTIHAFPSSILKKQCTWSFNPLEFVQQKKNFATTKQHLLCWIWIWQQNLMRPTRNKNAYQTKLLIWTQEDVSEQPHVYQTSNTTLNKKTHSCSISPIVQVSHQTYNRTYNWTSPLTKNTCFRRQCMHWCIVQSPMLLLVSKLSVLLKLEVEHLDLNRNQKTKSRLLLRLSRLTASLWHQQKNTCWKTGNLKHNLINAAQRFKQKKMFHNAVTDSQDRDGKTACGKKIQKHLKLSC